MGGAAVALASDSGKPLASPGRVLASVFPAAILDSEFSRRGEHVLGREEAAGAEAQMAAIRTAHRAGASHDGSSTTAAAKDLQMQGGGPADGRRMSETRPDGAGADGSPNKRPPAPPRRRPARPSRVDLSGLRGASEDVPLRAAVMHRTMDAGLNQGTTQGTKGPLPRSLPPGARQDSRLHGHEAQGWRGEGVPRVPLQEVHRQHTVTMLPLVVGAEEEQAEREDAEGAAAPRATRAGEPVQSSSADPVRGEASIRSGSSGMRSSSESSMAMVMRRGSSPSSSSSSSSLLGASHAGADATIQARLGQVLQWPVTALRPGAKYQVRWRVMNAVGWSPWSDPSDVARAAADVPEQPRAPVAVSADSSSVTVAWEMPRSNGRVLGKCQLWRWQVKAGSQPGDATSEGSLGNKEPSDADVLKEKRTMDDVSNGRGAVPTGAELLMAKWVPVDLPREVAKGGGHTSWSKIRS